MYIVTIRTKVLLKFGKHINHSMLPIVSNCRYRFIFQKTLTLLFLIYIQQGSAVRLNKLFQLTEGHSSDYYLRGFLHVGNEYAVLLRAPSPNARELIYELYEAKNVPDLSQYKPRLLAVSRIPVEYIKDQLKIFKSELYTAKYVDVNVVPGTQVKSVREWQIERALASKSDGEGVSFVSSSPILRIAVK